MKYPVVSTSSPVVNTATPCFASSAFCGLSCPYNSTHSSRNVHPAVSATHTHVNVQLLIMALNIVN
jgi:hypothetical protein